MAPTVPPVDRERIARKLIDRHVIEEIDPELAAGLGWLDDRGFAIVGASDVVLAAVGLSMLTAQIERERGPFLLPMIVVVARKAQLSWVQLVPTGEGGDS